MSLSADRDVSDEKILRGSQSHGTATRCITPSHCTRDGGSIVISMTAQVTIAEGWAIFGPDPGAPHLNWPMSYHIAVGEMGKYLQVTCLWQSETMINS